MKKNKGILSHKRLVSILLILALAALSAGAAMADREGVVRNPNGGVCVNLRKWASFDAPVLAGVMVGAKVTIMATEGAWYYVWACDMAGYIHSSFVSTGTTGGKEPQPAGTSTATVSVGPLNMREAPNTKSRVITQLLSGAQVTVLAPGETWTQIRVGDAYGYVFTSYLTFGGSTPAPAPAPKPPVTSTQNANATIRTANGGNLNLRDGASANSPVIASFANGTRVRVITHGATWCKVQVGNLVGYMSSTRLRFDGHKENGTATTTAPKGYDGVVNTRLGSNLNLRKEPSTASRSLGLYQNGTRVSILGIGTDWLRVSIDGTVGYMMTDHVKITSALTPHKTVVNKDSFVNLREGAGLDYKVIKQVSHGAAATVVIPYSVWSRVIVKDGTGYISGYMMNSFLK